VGILGRHGFLGPNAALSPPIGLHVISQEAMETALIGVGISPQPVSSALQCVTALAVSFFGVYLAVVVMRLTRTASRCFAGSNLPVTLWERKLVEATNGLGMAPMLSVLLVSARLRALQLDPSRATDPALWVQLCMYAGTAAFFLRIGLDLSVSSFATDMDKFRLGTGGGGLSLAGLVLQAGVYLCSGVIYVTSVCILCFGAWASPPPGVREAPSQHEVSPMIECMSTLIVTFLAETALLEVLTAVQHHLHRQRSSTTEIPNATLLIGKESQAQEKSFLELIPLHFPIMICVLLVGIELRALQLHLRPPQWSVAAMYVATACVVAQSAWACSMTIVGKWSPKNTKEGSDLKGEKGEDTAALPGFYKPLGAVLAFVWVLVLGCLYAGTAVVLASVFAMEEKPLGLLLPPSSSVFSLNARRAVEEGVAHGAGTAVPPVSVAMHCVTLLTVVYFAFYLLFVVCGARPGQLRKWAQSAFSNVQHSLAFVPMLCVMMIAVRLRAMQLRVRDPQPWAQVVMFTATVAVIVQAACNLFVQDDLADSNMISKVAYILVLIIRNLSAAVLFGTVAALITALLLMQPAAE